MNRYARLVSIRKILGILVAVSVLFAPGMAGVAMASPHSNMQMTMAGHCQTAPSSSGNHGKMAGKSCCIAMCMAVAIAPATFAGVHLPDRQLAPFPTAAVYHNSPTRIASRPPRHS